MLHFSCKTADPISDKNALFELMPPSHTNIDFSNKLTYTEEFNPYTYRNFYNGGGVGLGDINNDGLLDLFFCGNQVESRLYLNKGEFRFEDITQKAGVACKGVWASGVAFVDINGDGWQDIYVCKSGKPGGANRHNELFINQHDLTFKEESKSYGLDNTGLSSHAAFFDYDRDGDLDCYLLNNSIRTVGAYDLRKDLRLTRDTLGGNKLYKNANMHFIDVSEESGIYSSAIGFGLGVSVGDLNQDTWPDLYISNDFFERDYVYINQQNGTFIESLTSAMPEISLNSMGADMADINNDAMPEIFVTDMLPESDARYKTKTTFENWEKYQRNVQNGYHHQYIRNALQLNHGAMHFSEISRFAGVSSTDWSWGALITDLDMDGYKDIFVANGIYKDLTDQDYLSLYNNPEAILGLMKKEKDVIKKLIDAIPSEKLSNYAFQNNGNLRFTNKSSEWGLSTPSFSHGSAYGDLDNDGDPDLVINNTSMPCFVFQNHSDGKQNYLKFELKGSNQNTLAIGTQITLFKDGQKFYQEVHPMRGFESCVDPRPLFGLGSIQVIDSVTVVWPDGKVSNLRNINANTTIKLNQSDNLTLFKESKSESLLEEIVVPGLEFKHQENVFNDFERDRLLFHMCSQEGPPLCIKDINGDGLDDIFVGNGMAQSPVVFIQNKTGKFTKQHIRSFEDLQKADDTDAQFFDADNDGDLDLYICSGGNEVPTSSSLLADRFYLNKNNEFIKSPQVLPTFNFESTSCVRPNDFDGDGDTDLFVGVRMVPFNYGVPCNGYILQNDGKGNFKNLQVSELLNLGLITDAVWADLDGDLQIELIIVGEWMSPKIVSYQKNLWTDRSQEFGIENEKGLWQSVKANDLDNDGDQDLIIGNWGLNSRIKPGTQKPTRLYINDFDQNGSADQILTTYNSDQSYPLTLRQDLISQIPYLKKKYLEYNKYKNQTIQNIFSEEQLSTAITLNTTTHESRIYNNKGGKLVATALPSLAQLAPLFDLLITDLNKDGKSDIITVGNFEASKPELGSYMAMPMTILLQSKKTLEFIPQYPYVPSGEIRSVGKLKILGNECLVAAYNDDTLRVFRIK